MNDDATVEGLYRADDLNFEGIFLKEMVGGWKPSRDIDWDQDLQLPEEKEAALAEAVTQYYYSNIAHVMLCGRVLEREEDLRGKKLALLIAFSKVRSAEVYGRYLGKTNADPDIAPYTQEYFSKMSEDDIDILLPDMGVLGGALGYGTLSFLKDAGDPLFAQIAEKVCDQKDREMEFLADYLGEVVRAMDEEEHDDLLERAAFYRERAENIVQYHADLLTTLDIDPEEVRTYVLEFTDEFYADIGIDLDGLE